jgi:hypothetical protein
MELGRDGRKDMGEGMGGAEECNDSLMLLRLSVRMLRSFSPGLSFSASAIPVNSGRSDDG